MNDSSIIQAELTWIDGEFIPGVRVLLGDDGRISKIQRGVEDAPTLPGRALLPGFVNAHSHAFQRALRGLGGACSLPGGGLLDMARGHVQPCRIS